METCAEPNEKFESTETMVSTELTTLIEPTTIPIEPTPEPSQTIEPTQRVVNFIPATSIASFNIPTLDEILTNMLSHQQDLVVSTHVNNQRIEHGQTNGEIQHRPKSRKRGRPEIYDVNVRTILVVMSTKFNVSATKAGELYKYITKSKHKPCINTIQRALLEAHFAIEYEIASILACSSFLWMGFDGSSTGNQRHFFEIQYGGFHPQLGLWEFLVSLAETVPGDGAKGDTLEKISFKTRRT